MNVFNRPSEETHLRIAEAVEKLAIGMVEADSSGSAGGRFLVAGNREAGLFGFVPSSEFFTGTELATECGITQGTAYNSDSSWIKYMYNGKVRYIPVRPFRHTISWDAIYNAGCVYGDGTIGTLPPAGRMGTDLILDSTDNSINTSTQFFLSGTDSSDTVAEVGDTITLAGFPTSANNGTAEVVSITSTKIVVDKTLTSESGTKNSKIYKTSNAVVQNKIVTKDGFSYRVDLMGGLADDPFESGLADRNCIGSEWNDIILPMHSEAKLQNWAYPAYAGSTDYWQTNLSDFDFLTHNRYGAGSYTWVKEVRDATSWRRGYRGRLGASNGRWHHSWHVNSSYSWRPRLTLL